MSKPQLDTRPSSPATHVRFGTWVMLSRDLDILPLLKTAGLDYARYDMEHTPVALKSIRQLVPAAQAAGIGLCVRPPSGNQQWIAALIEAGVTDLYVPQVHTAEAARAIVGAIRKSEAALQRGTRVHLAVMLESTEAFRNIDEIAQVVGVHTLAIGPADLAQELGIYGTPEEGPVTDDYRAVLRDAAARHGKGWEMGVWSEADAARWLQAGCRMLTYQTETMIWRECYAAVARRLREFNQARKGSD